MSQLAPVMLTAEQFNQLATKDYLDERLNDFAKKEDLNPIKEDIKRIKDDICMMKIDISTQNIISKTLKLGLDSLAGEMESRFNQVDYKIDTTFAHLDTNLNDTCLNHEIRIKKLESKYI